MVSNIFIFTLSTSVKTVGSFPIVPPSLVGAYYLQPPDARAIFLHNDLLCNDCNWGGAQTEKIQTVFLSHFGWQKYVQTNFLPSEANARLRWNFVLFAILPCWRFFGIFAVF